MRHSSLRSANSTLTEAQQAHGSDRMQRGRSLARRLGAGCHVRRRFAGVEAGRVRSEDAVKFQLKKVVNNPSQGVAHVRSQIIAARISQSADRLGPRPETAPNE